MTKKDKTTLEKFFGILTEEEKLLLASYIVNKTYESLAKKFDELLTKPNEIQNTQN